ncbi:MAG: hypothetical protein MN733_16410 [Nitrososphaera sp.]|nr:hypothetical protein [Nitrososphaera sp.]
MGADFERHDNEFDHGGVVGSPETGTVGLPNGGGDSEGTTETTPRRGRPKGSKNRHKLATASVGRYSQGDSGEDPGGENVADSATKQAAFSVQETKKRRGRPKVAKTIDNPGEVSRIVLDKIQEFSVQLIGDEAKFDPAERFLLEIGLQDTVSRISPEQVARVMSIVSPACLIGGLALYSFRMASLLSERNRARELENDQSEGGKLEPKPREYMSQNTSEFRMSHTIVPPMTNLRVDHDKLD